MRKLTKLLLFITMGVLLFVTASCNNNQTTDDRPTFTVGMECAYAPFNWTENIKTNTNYPIEGTNLYAEGYDVQMAKQIADALNYRLVIKAIEWDGLIPALQAGQIDAIIAGMSDTEERRANVNFTNAYYKSTHVLVMEKTSQYIMFQFGLQHLHQQSHLVLYHLYIEMFFPLLEHELIYNKRL